VAFKNTISPTKSQAQKTGSFKTDVKDLKPTLMLSSSSPNFKTGGALLPPKKEAKQEVNPFAAIFAITPKKEPSTPSLKRQEISQQQSSISQNRVSTPIHPNQVVDGINFMQV